MRNWLILFCIFLISFYELGATSWTVSSNADTNSGSQTSGTLRYCLTNAANTDTISFNPGIGTIVLTSNLPVIVQSSLTLSGVSSDQLQLIDGASTYRVFAIGNNTISPSITFNNISIVNGRAVGGNGGNSYYGGGAGGGLGAGGGIFVKGSATLSSISISSCQAIGGNGGSGGAITSDHQENGGAGGGGASFSTNASNGENAVTPSTGGNGGGDNYGTGAPQSSGQAGGNASGISGGGGGGIPGVTSPGSTGTAGGVGGYGGGGGAAGSGATSDYAGGNGGNGGFGAGGGGAGKGGATPIPTGGTAGSLGGNGGSTDITTLSPLNGGGGGGGAGVGASIFVYQSGSLSLTNCPSLSNGTTTGGSGGSSTPTSQNGSNGSGFANGIFLDTSATVSLNGNFTMQASIDALSSRADGGLTVNGNITLSQSNSYRGPTSVASGSLTVNGSIATSSQTTVNSGATLKGIGTVGAALIHGTLQPGNSIGMLTFDTSSGNVTLSSDATTKIELNANSCSQIKITGSGSIALGGTLSITADSDTYPAQGKYAIVQGVYTGQFASQVIEGDTDLQFSLSYLNSLVYLMFKNPNAIIAIPTQNLSGNSLILAKYLNRYAPDSTLSMLDGLEEGPLQEALIAISPARNGYFPYTSAQVLFSLSSELTSHLDASRVCQKSPSNPFLSALIASRNDEVDSLKKNKEEKFSPWITALAEYAHQSAMPSIPSFNFFTQAILAGLDYEGPKRGLMGAAAGYAHTHLVEENSLGTQDINFYLLSCYGNAFFHQFYISPALWGIFSENSSVRNIDFPGFSGRAVATIFAWQLLPHIEMGYAFPFSFGEIIPFSLLDWTLMWQRGYEERGASPFNASAQAEKGSILRSETGVKLYEKWERETYTLFLKEKVSYIFQKPLSLSDVTAALTGLSPTFTVTALNQSLNLASIGLDFGAVLNKKKPVWMYASYSAELGAHYWSNEISFTLKKTF